MSVCVIGKVDAGSEIELTARWCSYLSPRHIRHGLSNDHEEKKKLAQASRNGRYSFIIVA